MEVLIVAGISLIVVGGVKLFSKREDMDFGPKEMVGLWAVIFLILLVATLVL